MAIIGPRPLLVRYLARYNEEQHHRHDVRPGLTGYAQAHGRNAVSWEDKFAMDVWYTTHITFVGDILFHVIYGVIEILFTGTNFIHGIWFLILLIMRAMFALTGKMNWCRFRKDKAVMRWWVFRI